VRTAKTLRSFTVLAMLTAAVWLALDALRPKADWIRLECATQAIPGKPFPVRVHLAQPIPMGSLGIDLHARDPSQRGSKVVGVSRTTLLPHQTTYSLDIPFRAGITARVVRAILYLTPSGAWKDRNLSANSEDIPVLTSNIESTNTRPPLAFVDLFNHSVSPIIQRTRSMPLRLVVVALWCITAFIAWPRQPRPVPSGPPPPPARLGLKARALGLIAAFTALAEVTDLSRWLGEMARNAARRFSAYEAREPGQQFAAALLLAGAMITTTVLLRSRLPALLRVAWAALAVALGLFGLDSLSLHAVDEIAESTRWGIPRIQVAHLLCALTATMALTLAQSRGDR
jgi:hypothetical protein